MTDTTQHPANKTVIDHLAKMLCSAVGVDPAYTGPLGRGVHVPSKKKTVRSAQPSSAEHTAELPTVAKGDDQDEETDTDPKPVCSTAWYVGTFAGYGEHGDGRVRLTRFGAYAYVTKPLMESIGRCVRPSQRLKVRVVEKPGKPRLKVTHLRIGDRVWKLEDVNVICPAKGRDAEPTTEPTRLTGTVKWFNPKKGFGFIAPAGGGKDAFVHISAVEAAGLRDLTDDAQIEYELVRSEVTGKMVAENLKLL